MYESVDVRISINLSPESYEYLKKMSKTKKRKSILEEALILHKNHNAKKEKIEDLKNEIRYIKLDLQSKKQLIFSLINNIETESVQQILQSFLEDLHDKLDNILKRANE
jgi:hypothetical protein